MNPQEKQKKTGLKIISIIMAVLLWAYVLNQGSTTSGLNQVQVFLDYRGIPEGLTAKGPEQVAVKLWGVVEKGSEVIAYVDLTGYDAGSFDVPVQIAPGSGAIVTRAQPRKVQISLVRQQEHFFSVIHQVINHPPEDYELLDISVVPDTCLVRGEEDAIRRIEKIVGQVDLGQTTGIETQTVNLMAVDANGKPVTGFELLPRKAAIYAVVAPKQATKEVSVTVITGGNIPAGSRLTNVSAQPATVVVMGNSAQVRNIGDIKTEMLDLTGKTQSFQKAAGLQMPQGIRAFPAQVVANITIGDTDQEP